MNSNDKRNYVISMKREQENRLFYDNVNRFCSNGYSVEHAKKIQINI